MMDSTAEKLDNINRTLERQNEIMHKMLELMLKPENKLVRALEIGVLIAAALGIFNTVDLIRKWIIGG